MYYFDWDYSRLLVTDLGGICAGDEVGAARGGGGLFVVLFFSAFGVGEKC